LPIPLKIPDEAYEKLIKDCPTYLDCPAVYISSHCRDSLKIKLSAQSPPQADPLKFIRHCVRRYIDPSLDFTLRLVLKPGFWQLEFGYWRLAEFVNYFGCHEIPFEKWVGLEIALPKQPLPFDSSRAPPFPVGEMLGLRQLKWAGHRKQLVESWLPFTPSLLGNLTTLELECDIALIDCSYLLFHGKNFKHFTLRTIRKDLAPDSVFSFSPPASSIERSCLESLTLESEDDIGPLLEPFNLISLRSVTFNLQYPRVTSLHGLSFWKTVETVIMEQYIPYNDMHGIRALCGPNTQFFHQDPDCKLPPRPFVGGIADDNDDDDY
ncbi:hypothetical protein H0H93_003006, partial [Arthromyces matolae]